MRDNAIDSFVTRLCLVKLHEIIERLLLNSVFLPQSFNVLCLGYIPEGVVWDLLTVLVSSISRGYKEILNLLLSAVAKTLRCWLTEYYTPCY